MRESDALSGSLFSYVELEDRVPAKYPLRVIKSIVDDALAALDAVFDRLYDGTDCQSIAPERLLRAALLQAFYSARSERQLMEQIDCNPLFSWFVGLGIDDVVWNDATFSKTRNRLLDANVAAKFLVAALRHRHVKRSFSDDHFSVASKQDTARLPTGTDVGHYACTRKCRLSDWAVNCVTQARALWDATCTCRTHPV